MNKKMLIKITVDICMTICLLLLMPYSMISETAHEWIGMIMFFLFLVHHILNRRWLTAITKGKYRLFRIIQTVIAFVMFVLMIGSMVSGILLSNHIFKDIYIVGTSMRARQVHMFCAYWGFTVMSVHLGIHWNALKIGYMAIDTAQSYFNEEEVGNAIAKSGIPREEIFLTTKVWIEHYGYEEAKKSVIESMKKLKTDYLDLVLLHQPFSDAYGAYRALEELYDEGKIRAIGISNFYVDRMVDFASFNRIKPMVNQVETHIYNQQKEMKEWADKYGIQLEAWAPFGEGRGGIFDNPVIAQIAQKYKKTPAQVMLRWHIKRGVVVIPKSTHIERMEENFNVFDFNLSDEDMETISGLDKAESSFFSHQDPKMVEWFVNIVEERKNNQGSSKEKKNW